MAEPRETPGRWVSEGGFEPPRPVKGTRPSTQTSSCRRVSSRGVWRPDLQ
jgi:hypothetical protein